MLLKPEVTSACRYRSMTLPGPEVKLGGDVPGQVGISPAGMIGCPWQRKPGIPLWFTRHATMQSHRRRSRTHSSWSTSMTLRTPTILAGLAFTLATLSGGAAAQSYPTKQIGRAHV